MSRADKAPQSHAAPVAAPSRNAPRASGTDGFDAIAHARTGHHLSDYAVEPAPIQRKQESEGVETEFEEGAGNIGARLGALLGESEGAEDEGQES